MGSNPAAIMEKKMEKSKKEKGKKEKSNTI